MWRSGSKAGLHFPTAENKQDINKYQCYIFSQLTMYFAALSLISNSYLTDRMVQQPMHAMHHRHHHDHHDHHDHHLCRRGIDHSKHHCDTSIGGFQPGVHLTVQKWPDGRKNIDIFTYFVACFILHQLLGSMCFVQYQCEMFLIIPQVLPSHLT